MRFRVAAATLVAAVVFVWTACDEAPTEQPQDEEASFAAKVVRDAACETKDLPAKDYFSKANIKDASAYLRALTDHCNASNPVAAWGDGFAVLALAEVDAVSGDAMAGGIVIAGVWNVMRQAEMKGWALTEPDSACGNCALPELSATDLELALGTGVFALRGGTDTEEVLYVGSVDWGVWGIEPDAPGGTWDGEGGVLPYAMAIVYGYPAGAGGLGEDPLAEKGFDWNVVPWWVNPTNATPALAVGSCEQPTDNDRALVAHFNGELERLLPPGREPLYCEQFAAADGWGQRLGRLASHVIPLWPRELNATLLAGKSGSGKARELSPFYGYSVPPYAETSISTPAAETMPDAPICFGGFVDPDDPPDGDPEPCAFAFDWTTERGNEPASLETLLITARENNGATVTLTFDRAISGACAPGPSMGYSAHQIWCQCDNRELTTDRCDRLELVDLTLNKPGGYQICVTNIDVPGEDPSTLIIEDCTAAFHMKPNAR